MEQTGIKINLAKLKSNALGGVIIVQNRYLTFCALIK